MSGVVSSLATKVARSPTSPRLLVGTGKDDTHLIVLATGDRGLAGAFNSNIVRAARKKADDLIREGKTVAADEVSASLRAAFSAPSPFAG